MTSRDCTPSEPSPKTFNKKHRLPPNIYHANCKSSKHKKLHNAKHKTKMQKPAQPKLNFLIGSILYASLTFLYGVVIARLIGPSEFAEFNLSMSYITPLLLFLGGGIRIHCAAKHNATTSEQEYVKLRLLFTSAFIIIAIPLSSIQESNLIFLLVSAYKATESFYELISGILQRRDQRIELGNSMIELFVWLSVSFTASAYISQRIEVGILTAILTLMAFTYIQATKLNIKIYTIKNTKPSKKITQEIILTNTTILMTSLTINLPRVYLGENSSIETFSEFAAILNLVMIASMGTSIITQQFLRELSHSESAQRKVYAINIAASLAFISTSINPNLVISIFYGNNIRVDQTDYFLTMIYLGINCMISATNYILISTGKIKEQATLNILQVLILAVMLLITGKIPPFSEDITLGTTTSMLTTSIITLILLYAASRKKKC